MYTQGYGFPGRRPTQRLVKQIPEDDVAGHWKNGVWRVCHSQNGSVTHCATDVVKVRSVVMYSHRFSFHSEDLETGLLTLETTKSNRS